MAFPERFSNLPDYAFQRLRALLDGSVPGGTPLSMSIGEPKHPFPEWVGDVLAQNIDGFGIYPPNDGSPELLDAISGWIGRRNGVQIKPERIMALNGTREGLFNAAIALCPETKRGQRTLVAMPNPFYQVYVVAASAVGSEPLFLPATASTGYLPDFRQLPAETLNRIGVAYVCSPANPQGAVAGADYLADLLDLAERHDFTVFSDECYSEVWRTAAPVSLLNVAASTGADPDRVLVFNSLSKRSNVPGLRSGFVAGGAAAIARIRQLRAYAGAPLPLPLQRVAERLWSDEAHVDASRALYHAKFAAADSIFAGVQGYRGPEGGFFLWLPVEDGEAAALRLWRETGIRVLPGAYLAREINGHNPGKSHIRVALVAPLDDTQRGLIQIRDCLYA